MSPDIEWHIGEEAGPETVLKTPQRKPPRWHALAIIIAIGLGVALGAVYHSIPEPAPRPTPTIIQLGPTPPALPPELFQTIEREVQAWAKGDYTVLRELLDMNEQPMMSTTLKAWGTPIDQALYSILDYGMLANNTAWVDMRQYRDGRYFRETRFYHQLNGRWKRVAPDSGFWNGEEETADTAYFHVIYATEDRKLVKSLVTQFEQDFEQICTDLRCPIGPPRCVESLERQWCSSFVSEFTVTVKLHTLYVYSFVESAADPKNITMHLRSPRVMGVYDPGNPFSYAESFEATNTLWLLAWHIAYGKMDTATGPAPGKPLVAAMLVREINRLQLRSGERILFSPFGPDTPRLRNPLPLEAVWEGADQSNYLQAYSTASLLIEFVDEKYGAASSSKLLKSLVNATSLADAITSNLGVPFAKFEQQWQEWVQEQRNLNDQRPLGQISL
jgi:hypothetical protein